MKRPNKRVKHMPDVEIEIEQGLEGYLAKDQRAIEHTRQHFGPELAMMSRLDAIYLRLSELVEIGNEKLNLPAQLLLVVRNQLRGIVSALLRRRTTDAQALTRRSIEATGIAYRAWNNPELATVFNEAYPHILEEGHPKRWRASKKYWEKFNSGQLFLGQGESWKRLKEYYAIFSAAASHAGLGALIRQRYEEGYLRMPQRETKGFEVARSWLAITLLHWDMLKVFLTIMRPAIKKGDPKMIEQEMSIWFEDFRRHTKERTFWIPKPKETIIIPVVLPK